MDQATPQPKRAPHGVVFRVCRTLVVLFAILSGGVLFMIWMPGRSHRGAVPALNESQRQVAAALRRDVEKLAAEIGDRNARTRHAQLRRAADFIEAELRGAGLRVERQTFTVNLPHIANRPCENVIGELPGADPKAGAIVVGAHYDSVEGTVGANDNGSGVAAMLALARGLAGGRFAKTFRFVGFANEEPPYFQTAAMGSLVYARECRRRGDRIEAMISLETLGYFTDEPGSQHYPIPALRLFYPGTGNFIGFVGNVKSRRLVRAVVGRFRAGTPIPSEGAALPGAVAGVGWSDHWAFWQAGYRAIMVTDTAPFRYPFYHTDMDTPENLDYERLALVVGGLETVLRGMAGSAP